MGTITTDKVIELQFDVVAPAAGNLRRRIATFHHDVDEAYPVWLIELAHTPAAQDGSDKAASQEEFIQLLGSWLNSSRAVAMVQSLIARSNETPGGENGETKAS